MSLLPELSMEFLRVECFCRRHEGRRAIVVLPLSKMATIIRNCCSDRGGSLPFTNL